MDGIHCLKATEPLWRDSFLFTKSPQDFFALILLTLEEWKADSILEPPSGFELGTPGIEIQYLNG